MGSSLQASLWHDLAERDLLHLHLRHDLHHQVPHAHQQHRFYLYNRCIMHNYDSFFEEHFKRRKIVSNMSIISCWILGLIQALPLMSSWNYRTAKCQPFHRENPETPTFTPIA